MSTFVRLDEDHFAYLTPVLSDKLAHHAKHLFDEFWPGKKLLVIDADSFIDLTGQYELVPIPEAKDTGD